MTSKIIEVKTVGKINTKLDVKRLQQGQKLHKVKTIMFPYEKEFDRIILTPSKKTKTYVTTNNPLIDPNNNTLLKAYDLFVQAFPTAQNVPLHFQLEKNSLVGSGLGFSASNAVGVIKLCCTFFQINFSTKKVKKIIKQLGSDALFFYLAKPAVVTGVGDRIKLLTKKQIKKFAIPNVTVINSQIPSYAQAVFQQLDQKYDYYQQLVNRNDDYYNILQQPAFDLNPQLAQKYQDLKKTYHHVMLAGSGGSFLVW
ncbi:4-diphosphocytidyl-2-C-methyl-D-erythritol kinase [Spiroplasma syrphidicola EA-1]|uniref:4-diphosphocytidyl-2-C-methyl-D-erythritol kinase n=1 Tax=Spiroplasma syrphidicola EA-1 TaxID=1276229 RepID=R4U7F8_9MOLU|nr:4-diphosphocytidyl-2C-methyl-D-erythritol kinase [Spiroplasma syrphidicola]AGM26583.1 4-diphosphocytidyl-2-C-methyl-D-erythritol kinase [Spiroplasma syrphidicola EA-1]